MKIVIYGCGKYGTALWKFFHEKKVATDYFCQTEVFEKKTHEGIPIININELGELKEKLTVFIAIKNKYIASSIMSKLGDYNITEVYDASFVVQAYLRNKLSSVGGVHYCLLCNRRFEQFIAGGIDADVFREHRVIGGGTRKNVYCPICNSSDRSRWVYFVINNYTDIFNTSNRILHFAPESQIEEKIRKNELNDYYTCDISAKRAMHIVDIMDIPFKAKTFDYIIANHVLEHIEDLSRAFTELYRVLKDDGKLIISFPICTDMDTYEDSNIVTCEERQKRYGQEDHVRLFGKDYKSIIEWHQWDVEIYTPSQRLTNEGMIEEYGFIADDVVLICSKQIDD